MADPSDAEDLKLWPTLVEKQFIDILLEEEAKRNMPNGQMKKKNWPFVTDEFNRRTGKRYCLPQLTQKFQRLKGRYRMFSQLIGRIGMGWDPIMNIVTGSDAVWSHAAAVSVIHLINFHVVHSVNSSCKQPHMYQCL